MNDPNDKLPPYFTAVGVALVAIVAFIFYATGEEQAPGVGLIYIAAVALVWGVHLGIQWTFPTNRWSDLWHPERRRGGLSKASGE